MKVKDAVRILGEYDVEVIAGVNGFNRNVNIVEVMEVPDVESWAIEGSLILTTFYVASSDASKQFDIVKKLIENNCAGIIIKLGRFIQQIPNEIIELCEEKDFPVITMKQDVYYRDILKILNHYLYNKRDLIFDDDINFETMESALEGMADKYFCSIYVEDYKGRLLYSTYNHFKDGWRDKHVLYSLPTFKQYAEILDGWATERNGQYFSYFINRLGVKDRVIIPIMVKGTVIVFIHLVFNQRNKIQLLDEFQLHFIKEKIYELFMEEFFELHQIGNNLITSVNDVEKKENYVVLLIERQMNNEIIDEVNPYIHYEALFYKYMMNVMQRLEEIDFYQMFQHNGCTLALLSLHPKENIILEDFKDKLQKKLKRTLIRDVLIMMSTKLNQSNDMVHLVETMIKGRKDLLYTEGRDQIIFYKHLGINTFISELSEKEAVRSYAESILSPLLIKDNHLLETLQAYIEENGHITKTATRLFLNRKTVTNRLSYIKENLNMDLNNADDLFILHFCLKIMNQ